MKFEYEKGACCKVLNDDVFDYVIPIQTPNLHQLQMKGHSNTEFIRHSYINKNIIQAKNVSVVVMPELLCYPHFTERHPSKNKMVFRHFIGEIERSNLSNSKCPLVIL
ncbi:hypothetical protein BOO24_18125 [Vibrio navarrensis]|nr:hypothetical protein [Vibrio navarrensis]MBE4594258.1 hypothetical protein [Vibrio navarrensis]